MTRRSPEGARTGREEREPLRGIGVRRGWVLEMRIGWFGIPVFAGMTDLGHDSEGSVVQGSWERTRGCRDYSERIESAIRSPIMMLVRLVLQLTMSGWMLVSATRSPSRP